MDKTELVQKVAHLFQISGHLVHTSVKINHREIDIRAEELQGLTRKIILIECADYSTPVGVQKLQDDLTKLRAAQETLRDRAVIMHVSTNGYSPDASGYALDRGVALHTPETLTNLLINFDSYIEEVVSDRLRPIIMKEYQSTRITLEGQRQSRPLPALDVLQRWLEGDRTWLTILGDYGVGKSWLLRRFLYDLADAYKADPLSRPLPFFVPLQQFPKSFDYKTLILKMFDNYRLSGVHYDAFQYLCNYGRIVFLLDSFDEMAQHLSAKAIRENLGEILSGVSSNSKAIMTSRPTYFENRAERLVVVEREGQLEWHPLDEKEFQRQNVYARTLADQLESSNYARLHDLTITQRKALFRVVLRNDRVAYQKLMELFERFQELENISQRAVIARLLTTVAETLAASEASTDKDGLLVVPADVEKLNQGKIFSIIVNNLLYRDQGTTTISSADRLRFLRAFALKLQASKGDLFAGPEEVMSLVRELFDDRVKRSDSPEQLIENYYRTCRRHSGLTTEGQFFDTSGQIDIPVDATDTDSRVGFSHNSLREYLVADAFVILVKGESDYPVLTQVSMTDAVCDFFWDIMEYEIAPEYLMRNAFLSTTDSLLKEKMFYLIFRKLRNAPNLLEDLLGKPARLQDLDLSALDLSGIEAMGVQVEDCVLQDTDFRSSDLRKGTFRGSILERVMFDGSYLENTDFREATIDSIYVFDELDTKTSAILVGKEARQWLYSHGARVYPTDDLNPYLGRPWYEAAREVTRTLEHRIAGSFQQASLAKGTRKEYRKFADSFVEYLISKGILDVVIKRSKYSNKPVVSVRADARKTVTDFSRRGVIGDDLKEYFSQYLQN